MKTSLARANALLPIESNGDLTGFVGRFVTLTAGKAALVTSAAEKPFGLLLTDGKAGDVVTVAASAGGLAGTIRVKLAAAVTNPGIDLQLTGDGRVIPDSGAGARVLVAHALEAGAIDELVEAVLLRPTALS